jgi:lysozyme family protein
MSRFEDAIPTIMAHEGGWASDGLDGGGTNFGITLTTFRKIRGASATLSDLRLLSADGAADIYRLAYWLPVFDLIDSQDIATKTFDMAVNMGPPQGVKILQRATYRLGYHPRDDGYLGPMTLAVVNSCDPKDLMAAICDEQRAFYLALVAQDEKYAPFLEGWLHRAKWAGSTPTEAKGIA